MSATSPNSQPLGTFSSVAWMAQASAATDFEPIIDGGEADQSSYSVPAPETVFSDHRIGSRSTRQQRHSALAPSPVKPIQDAQKGIGDAEAREKKTPSERVKARMVNGKEREDEEEEKRTWNLRPRRTCAGSKRNNGVIASETCDGGGAGPSEMKKPGRGVEPKSNRQRGLPAESAGLGSGEGREENIRLWVALSRDEIEEDIFSMSGNRPSRRPRKRPKNLQKHLEVMFPGLCLAGLNAECFRAANSQAKGK